MESLLIETIAYDIIFMDYGYKESQFRYAIQKYQLQRDPEIKEYLDDYYMS